MDLQEKALAYHDNGKIEIKVKKPCETADDLSLAYTPGVAVPCKEIEANNELAYKYTNKGNLVAVISDGTAVLGLGDIGAIAGKPVMEGKSVLFKKFANVDAFDIELDEHDPDKIVEICKALAPTFGGINLEDIGAPKCFYIEKKLQESVNIPVMHDDQHGTAIITTAGLINALKITGKKVDEMKVVVSGSGAAGIACAKMYRNLGVKNIIMLDSKGVIHTKRENLTPEKMDFAIDTDARTLADAMKGADMFLGLSKAGVLHKDMVASMAPNPIIFALANPTPEIMPEIAHSVRDDIMMGTGRSDYPNQVNNVLGFPFIFRGALDVRATKITENMKIAAADALAKLAEEEVPSAVTAAYNGKEIKFGKDYIIPKPFDPRVLFTVAPAVAEAAIKDGVALVKDFDKAAYIEKLKKLF
ncbi:malic enzyme-like NAD(P)-binding protein [Campylobacter hyointestinalis]|uniref:Malate dehydrogenase n=1 Tax=Campylobacter hyointestinalis subsp. hyointestinalis TaxID=91352 RepID=A0A855N7N4_CAMHY|nr:malic enzyme-like NAD(P)-binding protein [Campylobacter hyointestinalis]PPB59666.1 malate dehydrogenase [Campylobacter hyointestinalis subsp. hyointestinalis]PPB59894.1 malate dehydrogenase [Campylobacter hyointestinalis subsp. hyointestinalis]PPB64526.1 malate dehydrogenase [Campylobacter hyointestinalis subsp. hyointestinalis]PPB64691.1 malate dehydrogenase [Campylobacter hyointestinalis subsp. hyointestinalis]PPB72497.1 malate dehydrogenase [Campylobacter hyointestinalis subsp. hyointest